MRPQLVERLRELGIAAGDLSAHRRTPWDVWLALERRWGHRITLVDLYDLEAERRGVRIEELSPLDRHALARRVLAVHFPGWQVPAGTSFRGDPVEVVPYDDTWPARFEGWRDRLAAGLGDVAVRIDHVGSTAVPGLDAKPVIDIQVSVDDLGDESRYVPGIEATGVELQSREDERRYFRPPPGTPRVVQVHVCAAGGVWERDHLLFRDYLRTHPHVVDAYAELKRELARRWRSDRLAYNAEKTEFILDSLDGAQRWATDTR